VDAAIQTQTSAPLRPRLANQRSGRTVSLLAKHIWRRLLSHWRHTRHAWSIGERVSVEVAGFDPRET
jgi:hypothetical protein